MSNVHWGRILEVIQTERMPLTKNRMQHMTIDGVWLDLIGLSDRLWAFLGARMKDPLYMNRLQMVSGEDGNGLELWRKLYMQCEGGAEQVHMAGVHRFMTFGQCPSRSKLASYLGEWEHLRRRYGGHIPDEFLYTMLLNILPKDVAAEVRDRRQRLNTTDLVLEYLHYELARYNDHFLSQLHEKQDSASLAASHSNPVNAVVETEKRVSDMMAQFESRLAAFQKQTETGG